MGHIQVQYEKISSSIPDSQPSTCDELLLLGYLFGKGHAVRLRNEESLYVTVERESVKALYQVENGLAWLCLLKSVIGQPSSLRRFVAVVAPQLLCLLDPCLKGRENPNLSLLDVDRHQRDAPTALRKLAQLALHIHCRHAENEKYRSCCRQQ